MKELEIPYFGGTVASLSPEAISDTSAQRELNAMHDNGALQFRRGYKNLQGAQTNFTALYGFFYCQGYNSSNTEVEEYVSFENLGSGVNAYYRNASTLAVGGAITGASSLHASDWAHVNFNTTAFFINPSHTVNVIRHLIGNSASWVPLAIPADPVTALTYRIDLAALSGSDQQQYATMNWNGTDVGDVTRTGCVIVSSSSFTLSVNSGQLRITHENSGALGSWEVDLNAITAGVQNWQYNDVFAFSMTPVAPTNGGYFKLDPTSVKVTFRNNDGSPKVLIPTKTECLNIGSEDIPVYAVRVQFDNKTRADWDNVRYFKVSYRYAQCDEYQVNNKMDISDVTIGCCVFAKPSNPFASGSADAAQTKDVMRFGYGYLVNATSLRSGIGGTVDIPVEDLKGQFRFKELDPLGCWLTLTMTASADSSVDNNELYWQDDEAKWRKIVTQSDATASYTIKLSYPEMLALTQYQPAPFKTSNCVNAFVYRESVCWLYAEGISNVRYSRINLPESQASNYDEADDETRGATYTLTDTMGDSPLAGCQAGDSAVIGGNTGIYEQIGESPPSLSPPKRIPGGHGLANRFAFCRWHDDYGNPGAVYVDRHGAGAWFVLPSGSGDRDEDGKILPLTDSARDWFREFLMVEQGLSDFSTCRVFVDEAQDALCILMGQRLMKLPRPNLATGNREWEYYRYNTGSSSATIKYVSSSSKRRVRWMRSTGKVDEFEWNSLDSVWIEGIARDGGNVAPPGFWRGKDMDGPNRRIFQFYVERKPDHLPVTVRWLSERLKQTYVVDGGKRFMRCGVRQQGRRHTLEVQLVETSPKITRFFWHESQLGGRWNR